MAKYNGKNALLPSKSPLSIISSSYTEYIPISKTLSKPRDVNSQHQCTSSESFLIEEQPPWLDELLDEPDTPVQRGGHHRSSSDSFAYTDFTNVGGMNYIAQDDKKYNKITPASSWGSQDFAIYRDDLNPCGLTKNRPWYAPAVASPGLPSPQGNIVKSFSSSQDTDRNRSLSTKKPDAGPQDPKRSTQKKDSSHARSPKTETRRAKQKFSQRSRQWMLQYRVELKTKVEALQVQGCAVSAELEFLNQQRIILSMENKALKQRLEGLAQEQHMKYLEHQALQREVRELRSMYLGQQLSKLSLKHNEAAPSYRNSE